MMIKKLLKAFLPYGFIYIYHLIKIQMIKHEVTKRIKHLPEQKHSCPKFIVTLTSYGILVKTAAPYAICTLLNQTVAPDKIILWLAHGTKIPNRLKRLVEYGLEIKFCDDIKSYKKLIPALLEFPDDVLITADDDIYYQCDWFEKMKKAYINDPTKIYCHRAHEICFDENKNIIPYTDWRCAINTIENENRIFPTGACGILYPPHSLNNRCINSIDFLQLAPSADDIWFWAMAKINGTKHAIIKNGYSYLEGIPHSGPRLCRDNEGKGLNDKQLKAVLNCFPNIKYLLV